MNCVEYKRALALALESVTQERIEAVAGVLRSGLIFAVGNGGSAATASHFVVDVVKAGGLRATGFDASTITAFGNDLAYGHVFSAPLERIARKGDVLAVFSVGGNSPNVVSAMRTARDLEIRTVAFLGRGGRAGLLAEEAILIPSDHYGIVEDAHLSVVHMLVEYLRDA